MPDLLEYFNFDPEKWSIEGGEELSHLQKRIKSTVLEIASRHEGQTVAAVSRLAVCVRRLKPKNIIANLTPYCKHEKAGETP